MLIILSFIILVIFLTYFLKLTYESEKRNLRKIGRKNLPPSAACFLSPDNLSQATNLDIWDGKSLATRKPRFLQKGRKEIHQWILDIENGQHPLALPEMIEESEFLIYVSRMKEKQIFDQNFP